MTGRGAGEQPQRIGGIESERPHVVRALDADRLPAAPLVEEVRADGRTTRRASGSTLAGGGRSWSTNSQAVPPSRLRKTRMGAPATKTTPGLFRSSAIAVPWAPGNAPAGRLDLPAFERRR
ncbi:MAG TPA: hypothetical protein VGG06_30895 [Thermoanaerobaculia bacterium]